MYVSEVCLCCIIIIKIHNYKWGTNEDVHTVHVCMYIHCTVYMFIQANIHTVCIHDN